MRLIDADNLAAKIMMEAPDFMDGGSSITKAFILAMVKTRSITPTVDAVQIVRCKDCKHKPTWEHNRIEFPDYECPCQCEDCFYSWIPKDDWYCKNGERRQDDV